MKSGMIFASLLTFCLLLIRTIDIFEHFLFSRFFDQDDYEFLYNSPSCFTKHIVAVFTYKLGLLFPRPNNEQFARYFS